MTFECSECGVVHDELPRYFMRRLPETSGGATMKVEHEGKSMCRSAHQQFVRCEVEVPLAASKGEVLGFIVWVEVNAKDYKRILTFRTDEEANPIPRGLVAGTLANPVSGVSDSFGTPVKFKVRKGDPTPYIKWVLPGSPLAVFLSAGASSKFWHDVAARRF